MSIPTVVLLRDGREVARLDGLIRPDDVHAMITEATSRSDPDGG
jgi:thioredoxin-like negative regulator of GroEL